MRHGRCVPHARCVPHGRCVPHVRCVPHPCACGPVLGCRLDLQVATLRAVVLQSPDARAAADDAITAAHNAIDAIRDVCCGQRCARHAAAQCMQLGRYWAAWGSCLYPPPWRSTTARCCICARHMHACVTLSSRSSMVPCCRPLGASRSAGQWLVGGVQLRRAYVALVHVLEHHPSHPVPRIALPLPCITRSAGLCRGGGAGGRVQLCTGAGATVAAFRRVARRLPRQPRPGA